MHAESSPPGCSRQALGLLGMWNDLALQHVSLGAGCACGIGGVDVRLQDFEHDIVDYLQAEAQRLKRDDVAAFIQYSMGRDQPDASEIVRLLTALSEGPGHVDARVAEWLLQRLDRTLSSFARLHGGRR